MTTAEEDGEPKWGKNQFIQMSIFICYLKFLLVLGYFLVRNCFSHNFISTANFTRRLLDRGNLTLMSGVDELRLNKMG